MQRTCVWTLTLHNRLMCDNCVIQKHRYIVSTSLSSLFLQTAFYMPQRIHRQHYFVKGVRYQCLHVVDQLVARG